MNERTEQILRNVHFYRYMSALDVAHLLYSPRSLNYVRDILNKLAGGSDYQKAQYLYRFRLPSAAAGNTEKIYTLGSKGRDYLARELGLPAEWYFRPEKMKHMGYSQIVHNLVLTRFLVGAYTWSEAGENFRIKRMRICYGIARTPPIAECVVSGRRELVRVIPDAWLEFKRLTDGETFPVMFEIDRGMEYRQKFKQHVRSRLELITSGGYEKAFGTDAVLIAYVTTAALAEHRLVRQRAMCAWTNEVLKELQLDDWAGVFRFHALSLEEVYSGSIFSESVWYRPGSATPLPLFTS